MTDQLEPISPREALEMYLNDIDGELSPNSVQSKKYQLGFFVDWCEGAENGSDSRVTNLNEIRGRDFTRFKNWRTESINKVTLRTNLSALREFMRFCVNIDAVDPSIPEKINVPKLENGENEREEFISADEATTILEYLRTFEYASLDHALFLLQWKCGVRMGALHGLDVGDFDYDGEQLKLRHRPDTGTRLKNGKDGERNIAIDPKTVETIRDYIDYQRCDVTDEYGREPLFTTEYGRMNKQHMNKHVYQVTTPCQFGMDCPAGKDPLDCEHTGSYDRILKCPHNTRPHDVRRGSITHWLRNDIPEKAISDRMNVSMKTLDRHYDRRTNDEKADIRRQYLDEV